MKGRSLSMADKRVLLAIQYGTLPTGQWLHNHSWPVDGSCQTCGESQSLLHLLAGCPAEPPPSEDLWG